MNTFLGIRRRYSVFRLTLLRQNKSAKNTVLRLTPRVTHFDQRLSASRWLVLAQNLYLSSLLFKCSKGLLVHNNATTTSMCIKTRMVGCERRKASNMALLYYTCVVLLTTIHVLCIDLEKFDVFNRSVVAIRATL